MKPDPANNPLVVRRPGDELTEPEIMTAWAAIQRNPSALAAAETELRQDEDLRAMLRQEINAPADLLSGLLDIPLPTFAGAAQSNVQPRRTMFRWAAAAAAAGIGGGVYYWQRSDQPTQIVFDHWRLQAIQWAASPDLAITSEQLPPLLVHLERLKAIQPKHIPASLRAEPTLGCQVLKVDNGQISIVCFTHKGQAYHLFTANQDEITGAGDALLPGTPKLWSESGWSLASWRSDPQAMMVLTQAPLEDLRAIFG